MSDVMHHPKYAVQIGLRGMALAEVLKDTLDEYRTGPIQKIYGAIEASVTPGEEAQDLHADDGIYAHLAASGPIELAVTLAAIGKALEAWVFGHRIDANGVMVKREGDKPKTLAVGFISADSDGGDTYVWLYKCTPKLLTRTFRTKEGTTITPQTPVLNLTGMRRDHDKSWETSFNTLDADINLAALGDWLDKVYVPALDATPAWDGPIQRVAPVAKLPTTGQVIGTLYVLTATDGLKLEGSMWRWSGTDWMEYDGA